MWFSPYSFEIKFGYIKCAKDSQLYSSQIWRLEKIRKMWVFQSDTFCYLRGFPSIKMITIKILFYSSGSWTSKKKVFIILLYHTVFFN